MNVLILLGRGIEGTGQTHITIEMHDYIKKHKHNVITLANSEKKWGRAKAQKHEMIEHNFKKGQFEIPKEFLPLDKIIISSVPAKNYSEEGIENFTQFLEKYGKDCQVSYTQVDHNILSIKRNYYDLEQYKDRFFDLVDVIVTHSLSNDFCLKFLNKQSNLFGDKEYNVKELLFISCDFDSIKKSKYEDKIDKLCYFIGRSAFWKGWVVLRDFHWNHLKKAGYVTIIDGVELSINGAKAIYTETKPKRVEHEQNIYKLFDPREPWMTKRNMPSIIFGMYDREEGLARVGKAKFGMFFTFMGEKYAGPVENTMLEIIAVGTVPVIRKKLYDSARYEGGRMNDYTPEEIGVVLYDEDNPQPCVDLMNKLNLDEKLYKQYLKRSLKWGKKYFDQEVAIGNLWRILEDEK